MFGKLLSTQNDFSLLILRLLLGAVMWVHGAQKLFGMFNGGGFEGTMGFFTGTLGLPWVVAFLIIMMEFFGAIALALGFFTRLMALGFTAIMVSAAYMLHSGTFFMNWGKKANTGEGYEYFILAVAISIALLIKGGGMASVDGIIAKKLSR